LKRRDFVRGALAVPALRACAYVHPYGLSPILPTEHSSVNLSRVRPGEPGWPAEEKWVRLRRQLKGSLERPVSPFANCSSQTSLRARKRLSVSGTPTSSETNLR
jgi:hypothetical protein